MDMESVHAMDVVSSAQLWFQGNISVLCFPEHADILLHKAFLVGIYGQIDTSSMIAESMKVLRMEATT